MWTVSNVITVENVGDDNRFQFGVRGWVRGTVYEYLQPLCAGSKQQCLDYIASGDAANWPGRTVMHSPTGKLQK